jgi:hypothetical protein
VRTVSPVSVFHKRTVKSRDPEHTYTPSGENDTLLTPSSCPFNVRIRLPVRVAHNFTVLSYDPEQMYFPSEENDTLKTQSVCPVNTFGSLSLPPFIFLTFFLVFLNFLNCFLVLEFDLDLELFFVFIEDLDLKLFFLFVITAILSFKTISF